MVSGVQLDITLFFLPHITGLKWDIIQDFTSLSLLNHLVNLDGSKLKLCGSMSNFL